MLKNYTSETPVNKSLEKVQRLLVSHGAEKIQFEYSGQVLTGISFMLNIHGQVIGFKLPARVENVERILFGGVDRYGNLKIPTERQKDQAVRTAWKNIADWVEIQMTLIEIELAHLEEIFLPYMIINKEGDTMFEKLSGSNFLLGSGKE